MSHPRQLEIGPGKTRLPGFETLDVVPGRQVDHVADARRLPFPPATFDLVYASHVIEHVPWYETDDLVREWARVLKPGGALEVWTVNALFVAEALVHFEKTGAWTGPHLGPGSWKDAWIQGDPVKWCNGRLFCYAKSGKAADPFWHHALFTPRSLRAAFVRAGLTLVRAMDRSEVRGKDHGVINLGMRGEKPAC